MSVSNCQNLNGLNKKQTNKKNTPPCGSTRRRRWPRSVRWGPTPRPRPCSARLCSSRCSLTCPRRPELRSNCRQFRHTRFLETVEEKDGRERGWKHSDLRAELESGAELSYEVSETVRFVISGVRFTFTQREQRSLTSWVQPAPRTVPVGSRRYCWPAACQTSLQEREHVWFTRHRLDSERLLKVHVSRLLTLKLDLAVVLDVVEGSTDPGRLSVEDGKLAAVRFPGESDDAFCRAKIKYE